MSDEEFEITATRHEPSPPYDFIRGYIDGYMDADNGYEPKFTVEEEDGEERL